MKKIEMLLNISQLSINVVICLVVLYVFSDLSSIKTYIQNKQISLLENTPIFLYNVRKNNDLILYINTDQLRLNIKIASISFINEKNESIKVPHYMNDQLSWVISSSELFSTYKQLGLIDNNNINQYVKVNISYTYSYGKVSNEGAKYVLEITKNNGENHEITNFYRNLKLGSN